MDLAPLLASAITGSLVLAASELERRHRRRTTLLDMRRTVYTDLLELMNRDVSSWYWWIEEGRPHEDEKFSDELDALQARLQILGCDEVLEALAAGLPRFKELLEDASRESRLKNPGDLEAHKRALDTASEKAAKEDRDRVLEVIARELSL